MRASSKVVFQNVMNSTKQTDLTMNHEASYEEPKNIEELNKDIDRIMEQKKSQELEIEKS